MINWGAVSASVYVKQSAAIPRVMPEAAPQSCDGEDQQTGIGSYGPASIPAHSMNQISTSMGLLKIIPFDKIMFNVIEGNERLDFFDH